MEGYLNKIELAFDLVDLLFKKVSTIDVHSILNEYKGFYSNG